MSLSPLTQRNITGSKLWKPLDLDQQEDLAGADTKPVVQHLDC